MATIHRYDLVMHIFKIIHREQWAAAEAAGTFTGAAIDLKDGYIHFSTADQAPETAAKHFEGLVSKICRAQRVAK